MKLNPDFVAELRTHFEGDIRLDLGSRILYSTDASIYQIQPLGVVLPRTEEDLQVAVELAARYRIPILPRGSGTSLAGQAIGEALILDCSRWLNKILEVNPETRTATVEPGVILGTLNRTAAHFGLQFGPDPASAERATMGGVIANNGTGAHSILYGMAADHLLHADVVLSDGSLAEWGEVVNNALDGSSLQREIAQTAFSIRETYADAIRKNYPRSWRNSAGYRLNYLLPWSPTRPPQWVGNTYPPVNDAAINLAVLLAGSEGTLAVIRRAKVNLVPRPRHTVLGILEYDSIVKACDAVPVLLQRRPSAIELVPQMLIRLARSVPAYAQQTGWVRGDPAALLIVEFGGDHLEALKERARSLGEGVIIAESAEDQERVWNVRRVGLGILDSRPQSARPTAFIEDCVVPVEQLASFVHEIERILAEHGTEGGIYAHASAGCLHIRPILDLQTDKGVHALSTIAKQTLALTLRLGGAMSSEHGDGIARGQWLMETYGEEVSAAMRALKQAADPYGLLNPKKMFDAPPMDTHLRYGMTYRARSWKPTMDFTRNGGLTTAIEQCNGQGVCVKDDGVMCPSFQATREEQNSTRGRANLLRALISMPGISGDTQGRTSRRPKELEEIVARALDLCLACKGCKAECPSGVDMAKLKFEFMHQYYKTRRRPMRDYVFGYFHLVAQLLSGVAPLANFVTGKSWSKRLVAWMLGITPRRPFPKFTQMRARVPTAKGGRPEVIFLADPFVHYVEVQVEQAAFDILTACGFDVHVLPIVGAGATLLSKGFLNSARAHAASVLDALNQIDPDGSVPIVGVEPSEVYMLKHDYTVLHPDRASEISGRTQKTWLLEEFLLRAPAFQEILRVANTTHQNKPPTKIQKIAIHPHCHQHAETLTADAYPVGVEATRELLQSCGYQVELIEAGCCGMAGTFGYEAEHYELSQKIGALKLFPSVNAQQEASIVSTGAACRMQIFQGTGIKAEHPIILAKRTLESLWPGNIVNTG
jgi:FAD/FMN-containing dehydrogenase/Fe-S oxidoreductase